MLARPAAFLAGFMQPSPGPRKLLDQYSNSQVNAVAGSTQLLAGDVCNGWLNRTGPGAAFNDTFPDAASVIAALDNPQKGDSWLLIYRNSVAFAMTFVAGVGVVSGVGTLNCAASSTKLYLLTLLSVKASVILVGNVTNASAVVTGFDNSEIAQIEPGMGVTGTNIPANTFVLGVTPGQDPGGATVTLSANATGTLVNDALTFFPRYQVDALGVMTN